MISVLIPAYNAEPTIAAAVRSALAQAMEDEVEVLVLDDGSTDATSEAARRCAQDDPRVRILSSAENIGASRARNRLLDEARGEWVAFLDSDDVFLPGKLAACVQSARAGAFNLVTHDLGYLRPDGQVSGRIRIAGFLQAALWARSLIGDVRFSETLAAGEDSQFFEVLRNRAHTTHVPQVLTGVRLRNGSLTDVFWFQKRLIELWHQTHQGAAPPGGLDGYLAFFRSLGWAERANHRRRWLGQRFGRSAASAALAGDRLGAAPYLLASVLLNPGYIVLRALKNL